MTPFDRLLDVYNKIHVANFLETITITISSKEPDIDNTS